MSDGDLEAFLMGRIAEICGVEPSQVTLDGKLIGFGMDSVRLVDLIILIEETYDIEMSEQDPRLGQVKTVRDLIGYVRARLNEG